jgi:hypothetical protein
MPKLLPILSAVCLVALVVSGVTKHDEHGLLGAVSNLSWAAVLFSGLAILVTGATTLVRRAAR